MASEPSIPSSVSVAEPKNLEPAAPTRVLTWVVLALGTVFLAGGLWFAHLMGALTPDPERTTISLLAIMALVSAALGFVAVVTSAVSLARGQESGDETALLP
jgi:O-antigen/teichoic acid export membrane protein